MLVLRYSQQLGMSDDYPEASESRCAGSNRSAMGGIFTSLVILARKEASVTNLKWQMMAVAVLMLTALPRNGVSADKDPSETKKDPPKKVYKDRETFKCRLINNTGSEVKVVVTGYDHTTYIPQVIKNGDQFDNQFYAGDRVIVAYDDFQETVICTKEVMIDKKLKITLKKGTLTAEPWPD